MDSICGELQRAALKHMDDLAWTNEKREEGGDIIELVSSKVYMMKELRQWLRPRDV